MQNTSRPWLWLLFLAIGMATGTVMIGCQGNQYHVIFIERSETPKINKIMDVPRTALRHFIKTRELS